MTFKKGNNSTMIAIYDSIIFRSAVSLLSRIKCIYRFSILSKLVNCLIKVANIVLAVILSIYNASNFQKVYGRCINACTIALINSSIRSFSRRFFRWIDKVNSEWYSGIIFKSIQSILNYPGRFLNKIYLKFNREMNESKAFNGFTYILGHLEMFLGLSMILIFIFPSAKWHNMYGTEIVLIFLLFYFFKTIIYKHSVFNFRGISLGYFIFMLMIIISSIISQSSKSSFKFLILYLTCFVLVLILISILTSRRSIERFIRIIILGTTITGLYGIWQYVMHTIPFDVDLTDINLNYGMPGRITSTMGNPNNYAEFLILTIPFFWAIILNSKESLKKAIYFLLSLPPLIALFMTGSRSAWIAFAIATIIFCSLRIRRAIPILVILLIVAIPFMPDYIFKRILTIFDPADTSIGFRKLILQSSWPLAKDYWSTGIGIGTDIYMSMIGRHYRLYTLGVPLHTHLLYLQLLIEVGILGVGSFLAAIIYTINKSIRAILTNSSRNIDNIVVAGMSSIVGIMVMGVAEYVWYYPRIMIAFWMDIGILLAALSILTSRETKNST